MTLRTHAGPAHPARGARAGLRTFLGAVLVTAAVVAGCSPPSGDEAADAPASPSAATPPAPAPLRGGAGAASPSPATSVPVRPARDVPEPAPPAPTRVVVADLGIDLPVEPAGVDPDGRMALPGSGDVAAWYRFGPAPASPAGATVVAAHVDDPDGVGPFARLAEAAEGTSVEVVDATGTSFTYTVTDVRSIAKPEVPLDELFDRDGERRLVLVTCGGRWDPDRRSYSDNVVVTATPEQ
ncbi:sortase [Cellulosimicrobium sp. BIT-GX5]|uniref:Sortase n=1 Tax=Cellulosimicrobium composti TaxID=2672572 RepID=A0A6N7ZEK8_9MICO|nr:sortase [Cellulosimicrobium composti]TWG74796.1 sortase family protein [Cellulosimicrobium cellulans J34]SMF17735.1 Sortase family protein [Cellulosimicrobium cellulans J1]